MTVWAQLRRRWDIQPGPDLPFARELAQVNVGRIELVCLIALINNAFEIALGFGTLPIRLEILVAIGWIVAVRALRRAAPAIQRTAVIVFIVTAILGAHWAVFDLAARGAIYGGYLLRLLTLALLFVLPPRLLGALIAFGLASHAAMLALLPPTLPRGTVLANTMIVSAIAFVAGCLIFSARRVDYEQRTLIGAQNAKLAAQNAELDQLMAIAAHDLRSPLYGLRNLLDIADRRADADPSLPRRVLRDAIESLDAMQTLVTRLLDAHAAEHAPLAVSAAEDLRSAVQDAAARAKPLSQSRAVTIEHQLPEAAIYAVLDGSALARILDNLLANAIQHSPAGGAVSIVVSDHGEDTLLSIRDQGPGIAPEHRTSLFSKFDRTSAAGERKGGSGMGLFIAATFAARLGATLRYHPAEPVGATFELSIPRMKR